MTREETIKLLQFLKGCYPSFKTDDAQTMVMSYSVALAQYKTEDVFKAARYHVIHNKFFPTPAEIIQCILRANLLYNIPEHKAIEQPKRKTIDSGDAVYVRAVMSDLFGDCAE